MASKTHAIMLAIHLALAVGCIKMAGDFIGWMQTFNATLCGAFAIVNVVLALAHMLKLERKMAK